MQHAVWHTGRVNSHNQQPHCCVVCRWACVVWGWALPAQAVCQHGQRAPQLALCLLWGVGVERPATGVPQL